MATITVTSTAASGTGSLAAAIAEAMPGDTIVFSNALAGQTIKLGATLAVGSSVTITAPVDANGQPTITLDGSGFSGPIMSVAGGANVSVSGLTFANGNATGAAGAAGTPLTPDGGAGGDAAGAILNAGNLTLSQDAFIGDTATGGAGGDGNSPYFGSTNTTGGNGGAGGSAAGAIYDQAGSSLIYDPSNVSFSGDSATGGQGGNAGISFDAGGNPVAFFSPGMDGSGTPNVGGVAPTAPCFADGTRIRTTRGEVEVGALEIGDVAVLADGTTAPILWIGHRRVHCGLHPAPAKVMPVRIRAGALGDRVPGRDLVVSPDHALLVGGVLVPAGLLVDDVAITVEPRERVVYFHIELDRHAVLLAEGAPAESYLDTGNRTQFANCEMVELHPSMAPGPRHAGPCATLVLGGEALDRVRASLAVRREHLAA